MADVFVSYSRRDGDFVARLTAALDARGKQVWVDTAGIEDTELFPPAIRAAIASSEAFLFVITPESVSSDYCEQEVDYATSLGKRIIPVLRQAVPDAAVPPEIRDRNWIPFTADEDFESSADRVVRAIDTDLEHRKQHTRWLVKAADWDHAGRDRSLLLRGSELRAAERWLDGVPPGADPTPTTLQRQFLQASRRSAARRQGALLVAVAAVAVVAVVLGVVALVARNEAVATGKRAEAQALAVESQNELSADPVVSVVLARRAVHVSPIPAAVAALRQAMDASPVLVAFPTEYTRLCVTGPTVAWSPAGDRVAESLCTGTLVVLDTAGRTVYRRRLGHVAGAVAYAPGGHLLAVGVAGGVDLLDPDDGAVEATLAGPGIPSAIAFSPDGTLVAATSTDGTTEWDVATRSVRFADHAADTDYTLAFTPDGQSLVVGTTGDAQVLDTATGATERALTAPDQPLSGTYNPVALRGDVVVVGNNVTVPGPVSADIDLWDAGTWQMTSVLTTVDGTDVAHVAVAPDGATVTVGNEDGTGEVWSLSPRQLLVQLKGQTAALGSLAYSPDGSEVAAASADGTVRLYRAGGPWRTTLSATVCGCGNELGWQGNRLIALNRSGDDVLLQSWQLPSGRPLPDPPVLTTDQATRGVALSPDGKLAAVWDDGTPNPTVQVLDTATRKPVASFTVPDFNGVAFSPDDRLVAVDTKAGELRITTLASGQTVVGHGWFARCPTAYQWPAFSNDNQLVALYSFCGKVSVGKVSTARPFESFTQHDELSQIAFDPTGTRLALASWDSSVTVLDVATDKPVLELLGHTGGVNGVVYSGDGRYIATTSIDGTMRLWDAANGQELQVDPDAQPADPSFNPAGTTVVEYNADDQIRVWDVCPSCDSPTALLVASRASVISPLTPVERAEIRQAETRPSEAAQAG